MKAWPALNLATLRQDRANGVVHARGACGLSGGPERLGGHRPVRPDAAGSAPTWSADTKLARRIHDLGFEADPDADIDGAVTATWQASVDESGWMRLLKNSTLVADGQGAVPLDVLRTSDLIGKSDWAHDGAPVGQINESIFM